MAMHASDRSPLSQWKAASKLNYEEIAALVRLQGVEITGGYIRLIANGHRTPRWEVAVAISKVTKGAVAPAAVMEASPRQAA